METGTRGAHGRKYPDGPRINFPMLLLTRVLPEKWFPFDPLQFAIDNRKYGDIAFYRIGPLRVYQLNSPDLMRQILVEEPQKFYKPSLIKRAFKPVGGNGLLTSDGQEWKQQRKLIQPAFHHARLREYAEIMVTHTQRMMDSLRDGETREIGSDMVSLTLGIVVKSLFGADFNASAEEAGALFMPLLDAVNQRLNRPFSAPWWVPTRRNLREKRALARIEARLISLIAERRASAEQRSDLLSVLLAAVDAESGARMSDRQLLDEMKTLFLAGHETTANALTWTWYLLSQHPDVEAKLVEELDRVLGGRTPTASDSLPYTEMVVRESMRLYPPAPGFTREPIEDVVLGGYKVRKGSLLVANTYAMHRDAKLFQDPDRFDPERFAPGWEERTSRHAYLPFGGGPRMCIGNAFAMMEARLIIATMAQRWRFVLESGQDIVPVALVTVRPKNGIRMKAKLRTA